MGEYYLDSYCKHQHLSWNYTLVFIVIPHIHVKEKSVLNINKMEIYKVIQVWARQTHTLKDLTMFITALLATLYG